MSDPWAEMSWGQWDRMRRLRRRMSITLYGSYRPPAELRLLECKRDALRDQGYALTSLVRDGLEDGDDPLEVSKKYLENSDVNFLIFTNSGMRLGVVRELAYVAETMTKSKIADCVAFDHMVDGHTSIPSLSMSDLRNSQINRYAFRDESELCEGLLMRAAYYVILKQDILARRLFT